LNQDLLVAIRQIIREEISGIKADVSELKTDVTELKTDVTELKTDVSELKTDVSELKTDVSELKTDVSELKTDVAAMKPQLFENTQLLKSLLANSEAHGAKLDQLDNRVARLEGSKKRQDKLADEFYHHRHRIIIETEKPEFKAG
jgi:chromosome segregation ATPase